MADEGSATSMNDVDKIIHQLASVMNWLRSGKDDENIRAEMYSAAAKTCRDLACRIENLSADSEE
jgi:hypothetical protein